MNVLSLFDGMSCGQIALNCVGVAYNNYYASEIDKHSIMVTMANYPNTIQLGSVISVDVGGLEHIDLLIGGSPCQSFSFAGKRNGMSTKCEVEILTLEQYLDLKRQGFEFEGQSYLFWEYIRVLEAIRLYNPDVKFLLENVMMGEKWQRVLTKAIGINPIEINSNLVSAQNRRRLYWTNIGAEADGFFGDLVCKIPQPKDKGLLLKDVLEKDVSEKYYLSDKMLKYLSTAKRAMPNINEETEKARTLIASYYKTPTDGQYVGAMRGSGGQGDINQQNRIYDINRISPALMAQMSCGTHAILDLREAQNIVGNRSEDVLHEPNDKMHTLCSDNGGKVRGRGLFIESKIRRLTPLECKRLQTVPDDYKMPVSETQQYKMLGNGWTVDVIKHIFSYL